MDSGEGLDDDHPPPAATPPLEDRVARAEQPPTVDAAASIERGERELDCSHDILQPAGTSPFAVDKSDGSDRHLDVSGSNELGENPAERKENVQGCPLTDHKNTEVKYNHDPVCKENMRCGQERVRLRRQREDADERVRRLEERIDLLQLEGELLRKDLLLKEEELRSLDERFLRSLKSSEETYLAALAENIRMNAMLQEAQQTLEEEVEYVSGCPRLMQLLCSLREGLEDTCPVHTPPCPSPGQCAHE